MSAQHYLYNLPSNATFDHPYRVDRSGSISGSAGSSASSGAPVGERSPPFSGLNYALVHVASANSPQESFTHAPYAGHSHGHAHSGQMGIPGSASPTISLMSGPSSASTISSNYSLHSSRARYYLSKSFDIEDDLEFCPDIPETHAYNGKRFNPYTASIFSPSQESVDPSSPQSPAIVSVAPRAHTPHTPRTKKALDIVNPQTRMRVASPSIHNK